MRLTEKLDNLPQQVQESILRQLSIEQIVHELKRQFGDCWSYKAEKVNPLAPIFVYNYMTFVDDSNSIVTNSIEFDTYDCLDLILIIKERGE